MQTWKGGNKKTTALFNLLQVTSQLEVAGIDMHDIAVKT